MVKRITTTELIVLGLAAVMCGIIGVQFLYELLAPIQIMIIIGAVLLCGVLLLKVYEPRDNLDKWIYESLITEWKFRGYKASLPHYLEKINLVLLIVPIIYLIVMPVIILVLLFWFYCEGDITKFSQVLYNFMSIILIFIFMSQTWIFYHQYRHMKQPPLEKPLIWIFSKLKNDTNYSVFLKNGGNSPVFNVSYQLNEISVRDRWKFKVRDHKMISKKGLQILNGDSEIMIMEENKEEFFKKRLTVYLGAKSLGGYSILLFFYKLPENDGFHLIDAKYSLNKK